MIFFDIADAFDSLEHKIMLKETEKLGIPQHYTDIYIYIYTHTHAVNLEKVVHEKDIKIYLTRDYKYISYVSRHAEYIEIRIVSYDKTKV